MTAAYTAGGALLPADAHATGFGLMMTASLIGLAASPIVAGFISGPGLRIVFEADIVADGGAGGGGVGVDGPGDQSSSDGGARCFCFLTGRFFLSSCRPPVWRGSGTRGSLGLREGRARADRAIVSRGPPPAPPRYLDAAGAAASPACRATRRTR